VTGAQGQSYGTCPLICGILTRIAAEATWDEVVAGRPLSDVTPLRRIVEPGSVLAKSCVAVTHGLRCSARPSRLMQQQQQQRLRYAVSLSLPYYYLEYKIITGYK
jgi:hypothetical protein